MYYPEIGQRGLKVLLPAIRDYLRTVPEIVEGLPEGADGILEEGQLNVDLKTPVLVVSTIGDGLTEAGRGTKLLRLIVYVISRERGYYEIENLIPPLQEALESQALWEFLTFPPDVGFSVLGIEAPGTTASASYPAFKAEGRGPYVFVTLLYPPKE
jgi:hypothetical protein